MHLKQILIPALALTLTAIAPPVARAATPAPAQMGGWDAPPQELNALQRQGFHDGIDGARRDFDNHRPPNVENRDEYRNPHLPPQQREAYRDGFRRGYRIAVSHLMGGRDARPGPFGPPPIPPAMRGDWDTVPREFNNAQQRGFRDGIAGARRDFENHRRPDVNNRDEYRHPDMPHDLRRPYREGFRRGYDRAMAHLMNRPWHD